MTDHITLVIETKNPHEFEIPNLINGCKVVARSSGVHALRRVGALEEALNTVVSNLESNDSPESIAACELMDNFDATEYDPALYTKNTADSVDISCPQVTNPADA